MIKISAKTFTKRRFKLADIDGVLQLLNSMYESGTNPYTRDWWFQKFKNNPAGYWGEKGDIWVAEDNNKIVGYYAVVPIKVRIDGKIVLAAKSVNTIIHQDYRRLGMMSSLAKSVYSEIEPRYTFLFGHTSAMGQKAFPSMGWKTFEIDNRMKFNDFRRAASPFVSKRVYHYAGIVGYNVWRASHKLSSIFKRKPSTSGFLMEEIPQFGDELNEFNESWANHNSVHIDRNSSYLNWRFSKVFGDYKYWVGRSSKDNQIIGYVIFGTKKLKDMSDTLDIVDLCYLPNAQGFLPNALKLVERMSKEVHASVIRVRVPSRHWIAKALGNYGFLCTSSILRRVGFHEPHFVMYDFNGKSKLPPIECWYYSFADDGPW